MVQDNQQVKFEKKSMKWVKSQLPQRHRANEGDNTQKTLVLRDVTVAYLKPHYMCSYIKPP